MYKSISTVTKVCDTLWRIERSLFLQTDTTFDPKQFNRVFAFVVFRILKKVFGATNLLCRYLLTGRWPS